MVRVLHILPEDGIGGAETAARSAAEASTDVHLFFASTPEGDADISTPAPNIHRAPARYWLSPASLRAALACVDQVQPAVLVFSLWKSLPVFLALRLMRPRLRTALILHSSRHVHLADRIATTVMQLLAHAVWADSESSLRRAFSFRKIKRVLSFKTRSPAPVLRRQAVPNFIYWGRMDPVKDIPRALRLFARIHASHPSARLTLIGPPGPNADALEDEASALGIANAVTLTGQMDWPEIEAAATSHSFFIQLSRFEGMAMSVVEAMQLGLVPIVTPVGQIAAYCTDGRNAVIVRDEAKTTETVSALLADPAAFARLSAAAQATWQDTPNYASDFCAAARDLAAKSP